MGEASDNLRERIALARRNISDLTERAAVANGAASEERLANLLAEQQALLDNLLKDREAEESHPPHHPPHRNPGR